MNSRAGRKKCAIILLLLLGAHESKAQQPSEAGSPARTQPAVAPAETTPNHFDAFRSVGSDMARANHLDEMGWSEAEITAFIDGIRAALRGKPYPTSDAARRITESVFQHITDVESQQREREFANPERLNAYLKDMCKRLTLEQSDTGLCYKIVQGTTGARPGPDDTVVVGCAAFAADAVTPLPQLTNQNTRIKVSDMLPGFVEGIQMMTVGGKAIFVIPPALSFGSGEWPSGVSRGTPLIFQVSLIDVVSGIAPH